MRVAEIDLDVTSMGLVCSVGHDVVTACAAIRAGISRPAPIPEHPVVDLATHESVPLLGHPVTSLADGFCSGARWLQLAPLAFDDLIRTGQLPHDPGFWTQTAVVVLLPNLEEPRFEHDDRALLQLLRGPFVDAIASRLPQKTARVSVVARGHAGFAELLLDTPDLLRRGGLDRVIIVAVDSYVEPFSIAWLAGEGRLKTDFDPVGLMPGEAAAALMLEPPGRSRALAQLRCAGVAPIPNTEAVDPQRRGQALASLLRASNATGLRLFGDLNGESQRSEAFGYCLNALADSNILEGPVESIVGETGDTGAAQPWLMLAFAAWLRSRGHATTPIAVGQCAATTSAAIAIVE